jgi:hypothetical protein
VSIANAAGCRLQSPACTVDTAQDTCNSLYHLFVQDGGAGEELTMHGEESLDQSGSLFGPFHRGCHKASFSEDLSFSPPRLTKRHMSPLLVQRKQHLWPVRTAVAKYPVSSSNSCHSHTSGPTGSTRRMCTRSGNAATATRNRPSPFYSFGSYQSQSVAVRRHHSAP